VRRAAWIAIALGVVGVASGGFWLARANAPTVRATPGSQPVPEAAEAAPAQTGPFALGINEAVAVPGRMLDRGMEAAQLDTLLGEDARLAKSVGATLVRGHTGNFPRLSMYTLARNPVHLDEADAWVRAVQGAGLEGVLMVSPWPGNQTFNHTDHYVPKDMAAYEVYVARIVERYDGDGVDDMPGLHGPIRYWEVDNEPDLKLNTPPRDAVRAFTPGTFCTPDEYAQVLLASSRAIRRASPEARVLNGGPFRPHADTGRDYMKALFAIPGVLDAVDIVSLHTYPNDASGETLDRGIRAVRAVAPGKPLWVTETSVSIDEDTDADEQGRQVAVLTARAAMAGAERLFWHTLADPPAADEGRPPRGAPGGFRTNSLFATEGDQHVEKPAAAVFRSLAKVLATHDLFGAVEDGAGATRLRDGSVLLWDGSRQAPKGGIDLRSDEPLPAGATARAPAWLAAP
jgi:hypothetical protein